jgi:hypothetical protein
MAFLRKDKDREKSIEEFLKPMENQETIKGDNRGRDEGIKSTLRKLPTTMIILVILIIIIVGMVISLGTKISTLKADIDEIGRLKKQVAALEAKLEDANKDSEKSKTELSLLKNDIGALKSQNEKAEAQKQIEAKKKIVPKKSSPKNKKPQSF